MAESEVELKSLLMKVEEESKKVDLKLNIQKTKIMASGPITSWQIEGETMETVRNFIFLGSKVTDDFRRGNTLVAQWLLLLLLLSRFSRSNSVRPHRWQPTKLPHPWDSPGKNTGVGCHFLLQPICLEGKYF